MALPLLFFIGSSLIRAATPAIARLLIKQGYKKASSAVVKNTIKNAKKIRTIGSRNQIPIPKNKSLTIPKSQSTALTTIAPKAINKIGVGKATTIAGIAGAIPFIEKGGSGEVKKAAADDKKAKAKADKAKAAKADATRKSTREQVPPKKKAINKADATRKSTREQVPPKKKSVTGVTQGSTAGGNKLTFGKAFRAAKDAGKKEFTYRGKRYNTRTKDEDKKAAATKKFGMGKVDSVSKSKVEKKKVKKTDNMEGGTAPIKNKKTKSKKSKSFLDRVKSDFNKAVKETKRNFSDKRYFVNGVDSRKKKKKEEDFE